MSLIDRLIIIRLRHPAVHAALLDIIANELRSCDAAPIVVGRALYNPAATEGPSRLSVGETGPELFVPGCPGRAASLFRRAARWLARQVHALAGYVVCPPDRR